jgi:hypothetical protein
MSRIRTKLLCKHRADCSSLNMVRKYGRESPWWFPGNAVYRDALGRDNGGGQRWLICECNSCNCDAKLIVNENDILVAMVKGDGLQFHLQANHAARAAVPAKEAHA